MVREQRIVHAIDPQIKSSMEPHNDLTAAPAENYSEDRALGISVRSLHVCAVWDDVMITGTTEGCYRCVPQKG